MDEKIQAIQKYNVQVIQKLIHVDEIGSSVY